MHCSLTFPEGFVFGGATAAYQCEGETRGHGKGAVSWDSFLAERGRFSADPASDFYHQYDHDLELCERFAVALTCCDLLYFSHAFPPFLSSSAIAVSYCC